jgi:hypothetical protein
LVVKHAVTTFLQEALGHSIYTYKQLNDPKQAVPRARVWIFNSHEQYKYGGTHI